ncbi:MAG: DUF2191 domain-containing protein [Spirochaetes bacterium]|nr:DUF2191 domain-containing protein [Spirochaetota bacterium]
MKTTLNFPDDLISEAKILAAIEKTTLTNIIIEGLKIRLKRGTGEQPKVLPISQASGGLQPGYAWDTIHKDGEQNEVYR